MNDIHEDNSIKNKVLGAIESGKIKMRPKWHFVLGAGLLLVGAIFAALTLIYLASFIFFVVHENGAWFAPSFGARGVSEFFRSLPWLLVLIAILFIIILEVLVRRYSFAYRKPLLYSAVAIVLFVIIGGSVVSFTPFHRGLYERARQNRLPFGGDFYRGYSEMPDDNITVGEISEITDDKINLKNPSGDNLTISIDASTRFPLGTDLAVGDKIVVIGDESTSSIRAFGVKRIGDMNMPRMHPHHFRFAE